MTRAQGIFGGTATHVVSLALASAAVCYVLEARTSSPAVAMTLSGITVITLTPLFWRASAAPAAIAGWCVAAAVLALGLTQIAAPAAPAALARAGLVVLLTTAILQAPLWLLAVKAGRIGAASAPVGDRETVMGPARIALVTAVLMLAVAPVWLGPAAVLLGEASGTGAAALAASPLMQLAVAADADLLRTPWFYSNSLLGSVRFSYPDYASVILGDAAVAIVAWLGVLWIAAAGRGRRPLA